MRGFERQILAHLAGMDRWLELYGSRIYPLLAPTEAAYPYIVYEVAGEVAGVHLGGSDGLSERRLRLTAHSADHSQMDAFSEFVLETFNGLTGELGADVDGTAFEITASPGSTHGYNVTSTKFQLIDGGFPATVLAPEYTLADHTIDTLRQAIDGDNGRTVGDLAAGFDGIPATELAPTSGYVLVADGSPAAVTASRLEVLTVRGSQIVNTSDDYTAPTDGAEAGTYSRSMDILLWIRR